MESDSAEPRQRTSKRRDVLHAGRDRDGSAGQIARSATSQTVAPLLHAVRLQQEVVDVRQIVRGSTLSRCHAAHGTAWEFRPRELVGVVLGPGLANLDEGLIRD